MPGLNGSGTDHWQTLWEKKYGFKRVMQRDWANPDAAEWVKTLHAAILAHSDPIVLVAHSLGCFTAIRWAELYAGHTSRVKSAMLVAPPDIASSGQIQKSTKGFTPHVLGKLPFDSILVSSENDPYMRPDKARDLAAVLDSRFVNAGPVGHVNVDSGHGPWPEGECLLRDLIHGAALSL